jgi:hypothetical protein
MVDTPKKRFVIPMPPFQTIDAGVHARAGIMPKVQQPIQPNVTHTVGEMDAAQGLLNLQKKGGSRNHRRRSRKSRRRR